MLDFSKTFKVLTGHEAFPWQEDLYQRWLSQGKFPSSCNLPTGLGKTSVVAIWLIALANHVDKMPRRLVYVVNRRTVVDQTTDEVVNYRRQIEELPELAEMKRQLGSLALSTLRGQLADNREWSADPSRPAVIVGTVDMIGSRMLFSGYGCGKTRPLHAGFLGQDVLLVHDEAHLEPAFQDLLTGIEDEQEKEKKRGKEFSLKFQVMALSATSRGKKTGKESPGEAIPEKPFELTTDELEVPDQIPPPPTKPIHTVWRRLKAAKAIYLHENVDAKKLAEEIAKLALNKFEKSKRAVLVFVRLVEDVEKVAGQIEAAVGKEHVQRLTGTQRGWERDLMAKSDPVFAWFLPSPGREEKREVEQRGADYLICTSAGEVGVNLSADHLVCDLSTFDSMAQRFGRVNRFGDRHDTEIHVVHPRETEFDAKKELDERRKRTLALLHDLKGDGSPKALGELDAQDRLAAFAPPPVILPTSDILFDAWALTTIRDRLPGRPPVEPYLHGVPTDWQPPETQVAWREEVDVKDLLTHCNCSADELLEDYPLKPHELLRDSSRRVFDKLKKLKAPPETPVWIVSNGDTVTPTPLGKLISAKDGTALEHKIVLLPPSAGGLGNNGMLDGDAAYDLDALYDMADKWFDGNNQPRRFRVWDDEAVPSGMRLVRKIKFDHEDENGDGESRDEEAVIRVWRWYVRPLSADNDWSKTARKAVLLDVHTGDVVRRATEIVQRLPLSPELRQAVIVAAGLHDDTGKRPPQFQRILGNPNPHDPRKAWAKSAKPSSCLNEHYRHEFRSLLDVGKSAEFRQLSSDMQDLVLHLIAAHHGRARPHFSEDEAFDPERPDAAAEMSREVPRRFARLQRKYGRWGLAYLESLLRAADYAASAQPSATVGDQP